MSHDANELALLALAARPRFSWARTRTRIDDLGSPLEVLRAEYSDQLIDDGLDAELAAAAERSTSLETEGIGVTTVWGADYPRQLRTVHDAPPVLYWKGHFSDVDEYGVAVVGTRQPDLWGQQFARALGRHLAEAGVPVVSGLARGIDGEAMRGSLEAAGRTVGVIGTGVRKYYPAEHRALQDAVSEHLLISQFSPDASPSRQSFPMRNVVMSGFASMTVVVQAGETSGTRIQANAAVRHGRPLVITERVVERAEWARDLCTSGYDVSVVGTPSDALEAVERIHNRRRNAAERWGLGTLLTA